MTTLQRFTAQGSAEIDQAFAEGTRTLDADLIEESSERVPGGFDVDFDRIDDAIDEIVASYDRYDNEMDAAMAPVVHRQLDIPRRVATDRRLWHRLAAVEMEEYVRHRWDPSGAILEKFRGSPDDLYSNAIVRLWWIAELTHVPTDSDFAEVVDVDHEYELTETAFEYAFLSNRIVDNDFHRVKPVVLAVVDEFRDASQDTVNDMPDRIKTALTLMPAEGWVQEHPVEFVQSVKARME